MMRTDGGGTSTRRAAERRLRYDEKANTGSGSLCYVCPLCGVMVADKDLHDDWHSSDGAEVERLQQDVSDLTAMNRSLSAEACGPVGPINEEPF